MQLRHITGNYIHMPDAPTIQDIFFHCKSNNKTKFTKKEMYRVFENQEMVDNTLESMEFLEEIRKVGDTFTILTPNT